MIAHAGGGGDSPVSLARSAARHRLPALPMLNQADSRPPRPAGLLSIPRERRAAGRVGQFIARHRTDPCGDGLPRSSMSPDCNVPGQDSCTRSSTSSCRLGDAVFSETPRHMSGFTVPKTAVVGRESPARPPSSRHPRRSRPNSGSFRSISWAPPRSVYLPAASPVTGLIAGELTSTHLPRNGSNRHRMVVVIVS